MDGGLETTLDAASDSVKTMTVQTSGLPSPDGTRVHYFGDYELRGEIARGGMGVVYRARQVSLKRVVALKMILAGRLANEAEVQRFRAEAEAAANLQHPNIVAIHEIGVHEGQQYFSMDYVEGPNLAAVIQGKPLAIRRAAELAKAMAEAIHYAHQRGVLHRDLKPQNVLVDERGQPRITDFGLAKQKANESGLTQTGAVMGTPSYMPPEQAVGRQDLIGPHSDVYSLGAVLYEMLTGRPPFKAENPVATLRQVVDAPPVRPTKLNGEVPVDIETICLKCLEKEGQGRYATARALAEDLDRFLRQEPILARPISATRRVAHWLRGHPWTLAGAATILVMGLFCVAFWLWQQNRYLQYTAAHPGYIRESGARGGLAKQAFMGALLGGFFLGSIQTVLMSRYWMKSRGLTSEQLHDLQLIRQTPFRHVSNELRNYCLFTSAVVCVFGVWLLFATIAAVVWEGDVKTKSFPIIIALVSTWVGGAFFFTVTREQTALSYGLRIENGQKEFESPRWRMSTRLAIALVPGIIALMMVCYFTQPAVLKETLVRCAVGWMWASGFALSYSARTRGLRMAIGLVGVVCGAALIIFVSVVFGGTLDALAGKNIFSWTYLGGGFVGGLSTALAFRGFMFDARLNGGTKTADKR